MGVFLFLFFFIISITGVLLGLKKHSNNLISPKNYQGTTSHLAQWLTLDRLHHISNSYAIDSIASNMPLQLDKIEVKMNKGMIKFVYSHNYWGIQLDGATGKLLHIGQRRADVIENIHDGSILDNCFKTNGYIKLIYTATTGIALFLFSASGFWLWYGPKRMRKN